MGQTHQVAYNSWDSRAPSLNQHGVPNNQCYLNLSQQQSTSIILYSIILVNRQKTLITQKHLPDIKHQIQNLKKQLSYLDASVRLTQPPLDSQQIHSKSQANKITRAKNYPQQTSASQITRLCNQFLPSKSINQQSGMFNISQRSRSPLGNNNIKSNYNTVKSVVSSSKHPQSTNNLDYSYSPTTLKSLIPENECINVHQVKPSYDNVITPNTSNLSNSVIRCHSDNTQLLHRRGRKSNLMSAFSTMVKAPSNWRKGDDSVFDRSQSKIKQTDRVSSTDCTLGKFSKSELESDKVMTLQEAYIERIKKSQAIQARMIQRHQRSLKKMKKSSSLSSMIYPKWWKQMDPVEKPNPHQNRFKNSRRNQHQTHQKRKNQQSSYQSRVDRSAPVDFAPRNFNTGYKNTRDVSPPGTNTSFNISRISMNKSGTNQENQLNIDTLDKKFQEIHAKKSINGTASFQKYVQINPNNYEKVPDAPKTMPNKTSIQFTIPTEINPSNGGVRFLQSSSSSNTQPQKNERVDKLSRTKNQQSQNFLTMREKKSNLAWNRYRQQPKKELKQNKDLKQKTRKKWSKKSEKALSNVQSKIKRQLDFTRQVYRQTQKSNSTFIQIHCKQKQTPISKSQYKSSDNRELFNQEKLTERDLQCCNSQSQQFDEQVQKTIQKAQQNHYLHQNPEKQNAYYSMKPSISPLSSNQHSQSNSLSSTIINNKAGADRYIFYDKASQSPSPKQFVSLTHQSNTNSSGKFMGYIPNHYQGHFFNFGNKNNSMNNNNHNNLNAKIGIRRDSYAPQNQTAQFHPTSPSNGQGMRVDGSIASAANNYYLSASSHHQSYPGSNRYTARSSSNVYQYRHGPQLSTNSGGMIDLQTMNMAPQNTSGPPTFQNRPASHKTKNSDPLQIVTGFLNNPVMMNMFSEKRKEDHFMNNNNNEVIKTDQSPSRDYYTQKHRQHSQSSTPIRCDSITLNSHQLSNHQNFHHQTTNSESKYLHPRRDSTPLDFYKQIDGKSRPIQLESYENNVMLPRSSIGTSSNNTNKLINDRGGVMYSSHASSSSGLPRYPTINQDTFDNTSYSKNQIHHNQTPPWNQASYLQSYSGTTNRSGTPASQIRGPSPVTTINPVTMNTNSSVGTGGVNTQYQSRFQVSVETNSKLNTDRNNINNLGYNHAHQNQQQFNIDDYQSRFQMQSRGSSKDYASGSAGGSYDNYRSRSNSQERRNTVHSKHSSVYNNVEHNKQKMLNSGSTTLSNYQIPQSMKQFFCKQNPINIDSNRTSQNHNYPSSRRQYFNEFLKNDGAGVYTNLRINNQVAPLEDPPKKQKSNQFVGSSGVYQNRKPSGVPIMDTVEQLQVSRAKLKSKQHNNHQQEAENHQFVGKNINKQNIGPDSQSKRAVFKSCTNISKRTIFGSMNCSDDQFQPPVKNLAMNPPPTSSLVKALKQSETYVHKS